MQLQKLFHNLYTSPYGEPHSTALEIIHTTTRWSQENFLTSVTQFELEIFKLKPNCHFAPAECVFSFWFWLWWAWELVWKSERVTFMAGEFDLVKYCTSDSNLTSKINKILMLVKEPVARQCIKQVVGFALPFLCFPTLWLKCLYFVNHQILLEFLFNIFLPCPTWINTTVMVSLCLCCSRLFSVFTLG